MPDNPNKLSQFWQELKRRKVLRVITVYAAVAFVILQLVEILAPSLRLPEWTMNFILVVLIVGFIIAIILSWIYDIHPEGGVVKTEPAHKVKSEDKQIASSSWKIASYISFVIIIGLIVLNLTSHSKRSKDIQKLDKTIAVIPFEVWNSDEEFNYYLGDAIANEINTQLAKINDFHVFSYTSSSKFKGENKPSIPEIGQEIGANFIVEGSVERQDEDVSIHVQVIRAEEDDHIWANEFKGKWGDIFIIRSTIAVNIAQELKAILSPQEIELIEKRPAESTEAYNMVLLGNYLISQNSPESLQEALNSFEYAITLDPAYSAAYVGKAQCYQFMVRYSLIEREEGNEKAREAVNKAIELDDSNGLAYATLGLIKIAGYWDIYGPEEDFQKAIQLSPNNAWVYASYAQYLRWLARYDQGIEMAKRAAELDPLTPISNMWLGAIYFFSGQYDKSIQFLIELQKRFPDYVYIYSYLAYNYVFKEDFTQAIYYIEKALSFEEYTNNVMNLSPLAWAYAKAGEPHKAKEILAKMESLCKQERGPCDPVSFAVTYNGLGEQEKAFKYLSEAIDSRSGLALYLRVNADCLLKEISSDPRYIDILKQIGFSNEY